MKRSGAIVSALLAFGMAACSAPSVTSPGDEFIAPGAPGVTATWSNAEKVAIGTSYEAYDSEGQYSDASPTAPISKVWFSLTKDRITEVMWGLIHEAQIREIQFVVVGPEGIIEVENSSVGYPEYSLSQNQAPGAPLPGQTLHGERGLFTLTYRVLADPDRDSLVVDLSAILERADLRVFAYVDPALANTGSGDVARVSPSFVSASEGGHHLVAKVRAYEAAEQLEMHHAASVGFVGVSDGLTATDGAVFEAQYRSTGDTPGNVAFWIELPTRVYPEKDGATAKATLAIGFGETEATALQNADESMSAPEGEIARKYARQWRDYLASLSHLPVLAEASEDRGALAYMSAINLKIMEDKTHAGALIASLSNPWGETASADAPQTGYKAVWPRDFFQVASAFVAMGDADTARAAYRYLPTVQVTEDTPANAGVTGWFLQKTHVDGEIEWVAIQQDQTAMPIMLGWKLWQEGVISDEEMAESYRSMLKPAADFLVAGGRPNILWNSEFEASLGYTQQERWEEQEGYSPSTVAAVISGLVTAADLAARFGDPADAARYLEAADTLEVNLENWMLTTTGDLGDGEYFIRVTRNQDPNDKAMLGDNNGRPGLPEDQIVDGGFLELVRYGVRAPQAASIQSSLEELDGAHEDNLRVRYEFGDRLVGWRRYGNDGYGEDGAAGTNYHEIEGGNTPGQRGRVWPFFSGERGHFEIAHLKYLQTRFGDLHPDVAAANARIRTLVESMEAFANEGLSLPEQVWDNVGPNPFGYEFGEGTNSATPLAWTHAEYIKLLRSVADRGVWDHYPIVAERYADSPRNQSED
ncbi:MAG: glycoside hydrolase family 15 protein [Pseudomonadota bacterium]